MADFSEDHLGVTEAKTGGQRFPVVVLVGRAPLLAPARWERPLFWFVSTEVVARENDLVLKGTGFFYTQVLPTS